MKKCIFLLSLFTLFITGGFCQSKNADYPKALVSFEDYEQLSKEVKEVRSQRLISLDQFLEFQKDSNTVILDARSRDKFAQKHIKGAINLPFSEFTYENLRLLIPETTTRILIYCNNNIKDDVRVFPSKMSLPKGITTRTEVTRKPIMLALNIPTYINLYGYGYRNIYELDEYVSISDPRLEMAGKHIINVLQVWNKNTSRYRKK